MEQRTRFALIGAGGIAQAYAQAFEDHESARLVAVADVRADAARALAERFGCPSFADPLVLAHQGPKVDAVIVCTPPNTHEELSTYFLRRKVHVLCEKPFTLDSASAQRVLDVAREAKVLIAMASKFRYVDDVIRAKSLIASGILGEIILFENAFTARVNMESRWNSDPKISGGGVLIDNGCHSLDLMRYFLGPLAAVQATEGKRVQNLPVEDTVRIFVRSESEVMGSIDLSWSINKELDSFLNIYGTNGTVTVGWKESRYRQQSSRDWVVFGKGYDKVQAFRNQLSNFARAVQGKEPLLITGQDALGSVQVIEAAYRSMQQCRWTKVSRGVPPRRLALAGARRTRNGVHRVEVAG